MDLSKAKRVLQEQKRVNVDFPTWMIDLLDREAGKLGVTRQSIIKVWLAERLEMLGPTPLAGRAKARPLIQAAWTQYADFSTATGLGVKVASRMTACARRE